MRSARQARTVKGTILKNRTLFEGRDDLGRAIAARPRFSRPLATPGSKHPHYLISIDLDEQTIASGYWAPGRMADLTVRRDMSLDKLSRLKVTLACALEIEGEEAAARFLAREGFGVRLEKERHEVRLLGINARSKISPAQALRRWATTAQKRIARADSQQPVIPALEAMFL